MNAKTPKRQDNTERRTRLLIPGLGLASWRLGDYSNAGAENYHPSEGGAAAAMAPPATAPPLATLLTRHILSDGELILLILKPSMWYILLSSLRFIAVVLILTIAAHMFDERLPSTTIVYVEGAIFLIAGRIMWAVLQWMGRLYILTDMRIVRIAGVFSVDVYDCPLRRVARTRLIATVKERLLRLGSIEIIPQDSSFPIGLWQTVPRPIEVNEQIVAAMDKAKHCGRNGHAN
jgi:hypothetical protein